MSAVSDKIIELRQLLNDRFGHKEFLPEERRSIGLEALDEAEVPHGALTEIVANGGSSLLLYALLHAMRLKEERTILIDGKNSFSPVGLSQADLQRLLWLRCQNAPEAMKVADLAVRDGNVPLVVMLIVLNPAAELRRITPNAWHRLQMLAEKSAVTLLVFTPQAQIGCARLRLSAGGAFPLKKLHRCRAELLPELNVQVERRRLGRRMDEEDLCRTTCA